MVGAERSLQIRDLYPDLEAVQERIYPSAQLERTSIDDYEASLERQRRLTPAVKDAIAKARNVRVKTRVIAYIAGGLTGVDEETKKRYGQVSEMLTEYGEDHEGKDLFFGYVPHLHGTDPIKHPNVTGDEVRDIDHLWAVIVSDVHINFKHPMAHGNAIELGWAESHMIPTVIQNPEGNKLSRLVIGMNNIQEWVMYENNEDMLEGLRRYSDEFAAWLHYHPESDPREFHYRSPENLRNPTLVENGYDPNDWSPVFAMEQFLAYVSDPDHERYGQVGEVTAHDWRESGTYHVRFPDGEVCFPDGGEGRECELSFWLK